MSLVGHTHTFLVTPHLSTTKTPLLPILFLHYRVRRVEKIPKYQKMKLQKIPKYSSTKIPKYPNIKVLKDEIIKRSPSCSFARGELEKMIKRPKHPSPPYHLYPSKTFLGQLKWTESTRIHDTSYRPLDQPRNQIQRLDIDQDQDNGQSKDKTGTNRNSMIRSAIIKRLLGGSFPFSSVWKLLYCARFCKLLYFARDPSVQSHFLNCGLRPLFADVSVRLRC